MRGDTVQVHISDGYYEHEQFGTVRQTWWSESDVYEVPRAQVERCQAAQAAWTAAQSEMAAIMDGRREQRLAEQREDARRAEIRCGLYGGRQR